MREGTSRLRLRAVLASWFTVLVVVLVATTALGGWGTYTAHANPGTVETTEGQVVWKLDGAFEHTAQVTEPNPVFDVGATLTNRSTYFTSASPILEGTFTADYRGTGDDPLTVRLESELVHRTADDETIYWTTSTDLESETVTVTPDEAASVSFSFNASEAYEARQNITEALGQTPGEPATFVAVDVVATPENGDGSDQVVYTARLPVSYDGGTYTVGPAESTDDSVTREITVTEPREYGPLMSVGGPLALTVGLAGLLALVALRLRDEPLALTTEERTVLDYRDERTEFDEWVVRAELPAAVLDRETATADSFADLVDFAIDANVAVIEEPTRDQYYAVTPDLLLTFDPPEPIAGD